MSDEFIFDAAPAEKGITLATKAGPRYYIVREASAGAAAAYRNCLIRGSKIGASGNPETMGDIHDAEPVLVASCTYEADRAPGDPPVYTLKLDANGKPIGVSKAAILTWNQKHVKALFEWIEQHSNLGQQASRGALLTQRAAIDAKLAKIEANGTPEEAAKNSPSAATTPSE
jgi:hypothetical protein